MIKRACKICGVTFLTKPYFVRRGQGIYCSRKCHYADKTGRQVNCFVCNRVVYRSPSVAAHSKSQKFFCTKSCQTRWRNSQFVGEKHARWIHGRNSYKTVLQRNKVPKICKLCGNNDVRVIAIHHIDQNHNNNLVSNLAWLCHNCHYLVHHDKVERQKFLGAV